MIGLFILLALPGVHKLDPVSPFSGGPLRPPAAVRLASPAAAAVYRSTFHGNVAGYRLAGIEPDGDPLDQVVLSTTLRPTATTPSLHLIIDSYLENFKPDTTPILPNLLHPNQTATNLGGFLSGKALLTDNAGSILYLGSFVGEAFLDNSNNAVMTLYGSGPAYGAQGRLRGTFTLHRSGSLNGALSGTLALPAAARRQIAVHNKAGMAPLKKIISAVTVKPAYMVGRAVKPSSTAPLRTGFSSTHAASPSRPLPLTTILSGAGAVFFLALGCVLYWRSRTAA
jgi:hypothetical protein